MSETVFVRTRYHYDPYDDLFKLAELSGYPIVYIDEMDVYDASKVYILTPKNGEWPEAGWPKATAKLIFYNLEWEFSQEALTLGIYEKWTPDAWHARRTGARFVPVGSHVGLAPNGQRRNTTFEHDLVFFGYEQPGRRSHVLSGLHSEGVTFAPNGWGDTRDKAITSARACLHIHQFDNVPTISPLRWAVAAAYGIPIISETVADRSPLGLGDFMTANYANLAAFAKMHVKDQHPQKLMDYGHALHQKMCVQYPFSHWIERAVG